MDQGFDWHNVPELVVTQLQWYKRAEVPPPSAGPVDLAKGPSPLVASLVGSLALGGAGYLAGRTIESRLPETDFYGPDDPEGGRLRKNLALAGATLGALPGLYMAGVQGRTPDASGHAPGFWGAMMPEWAKGAAARFGELTGSADIPSIPVDAFNRAVWNDVRQPPNPFGTRDPFGDNHQALGTPPPVAAFTSGLVAGAGIRSGQDRVSPLEVGISAARAAGTGYLAGLSFGRLLGGLAGLKPSTQAQLQRTGIWGGLLAGGVQALLR